MSTRTSTSTDVKTEVPGTLVFSGMMMMLVGAFHLLMGVVALVDDDFYVAKQEYLFEFDLTSWGWVHAVAGVVIALAGAALMHGDRRARPVVAVLAALSMLVSFAWLPYYPFWGLTVIAFDLFVLRELLMHGHDMPPA
jgi:hypothetical protein